MATFQQKMIAVNNFISSNDGLEIDTISGLPEFKRGELTPPLASTYYGGSQSNIEIGQVRIGATITEVLIQLNIYAKNEQQLFYLAGKLQQLRKNEIILTTGIDDQRIKLIFGGDERVIPDNDMPKQEKYLTICNLVMTYE